jgi:molybdopterin biosynthesis enzyme MoaB
MNATNHILSLQSQIMVLQSRIVIRQTSILSGHYKTRIVTVKGIQLTESELLKDEMETIDRHIQTMQKLSDNICILANGGSLNDLEN